MLPNWAIIVTWNSRTMQHEPLRLAKYTRCTTIPSLEYTLNRAISHFARDEDGPVQTKQEVVAILPIVSRGQCQSEIINPGILE